MQSDILILGAGIGGYETFRSLARGLKADHRLETITLVDENNYFTFIPMLHEVASGSVLPEHAVIPLRELVAGTPHQFLRAKVLQIDPKNKTVQTSSGQISYNYAVVALGSQTNFFGVPGAEEFAQHVRDLSGAKRIEETLFNILEKNPAEITLTIVGGGYTGVELAGQFGYLATHQLKRLYKNTKLKIRLIQASETLIPILPKKAQVLAQKQLQKMGVEILFNSAVAAVTPTDVKLKTGEILPSDLTIWSAGFKNIAENFMTVEACDRGRIPVDHFLRSPIFSNLYAIGDIACATNPGENSPIPQLAEVAHQAGQFVARHILATLQNKTTAPFLFKTHGTLMPVGDWYGIGVWGQHVFSGRFIWWLRRTVYVHFLPGWGRKLRIVLDWTLQALGWRHF